MTFTLLTTPFNCDVAGKFAPGIDFNLFGITTDRAGVLAMQAVVPVPRQAEAPECAVSDEPVAAAIGILDLRQDGEPVPRAPA